jgi:hypothetical protein
MLSHAAAAPANAGSHNMGSEVPDQMGPRAPREAALQCLIRDANEDLERLNVALVKGAARTALRCECGDPACQASVTLSHAEYEAVRAYGSHFFVGVNHENPESAWVLSENERFAIIDVVAGDARYHVLARNPRHAWVDARDRSTR